MPRLTASLPRERVTGAARVRVPFGSYAALTPLTAQEVDALEQAILEEYGAYNLYQYIDETYDYGDLFGQIAQSEQQHVNALIRQAEKYGMVVPENPGLTDPPPFTSQEAACQAGVVAEQHDADLYDELMRSPARLTWNGSSPACRPPRWRATCRPLKPAWQSASWPNKTH